MSSAVDTFMAGVMARDSDQKEFHQAVQEVVESLMPVLDKHPEYRKGKVLERMVEPERVNIAGHAKTEKKRSRRKPRVSLPMTGDSGLGGHTGTATMRGPLEQTGQRGSSRK